MKPDPPAVPARARGLAQVFGRRRIALGFAIATAIGLLFSTFWQSALSGLFMRIWSVAALLLLAFGLFEQWPRQLPRWLARWVLQVLAVALAVPLAFFVIYVISTPSGQPPFWQQELRLSGFAMLTATGLLIAPWVALGALVRQREAFAREQALAFELERSQLERQALDARMHLLQAQVQPHFLFNTLANVRALVNAGSPRASAVLDSLIDYLRAAVPRLDDPQATIGQELELVRAYLDLMHLRMPDRLQFRLDVDPATLPLRCAPMTLLTLVENAVRHGVDPAEDGGRIEVRVALDGSRCRLSVRDSGVGLQRSGNGPGTGLPSLDERLKLCFGGGASLRVSGIDPHGVLAEVEFPAELPKKATPR